MLLERLQCPADVLAGHLELPPDPGGGPSAPAPGDFIKHGPVFRGKLDELGVIPSVHRLLLQRPHRSGDEFTPPGAVIRPRAEIPLRRSAGHECLPSAWHAAKGRAHGEKPGGIAQKPLLSGHLQNSLQAPLSKADAFVDATVQRLVVPEQLEHSLLV